MHKRLLYITFIGCSAPLINPSMSPPPSSFGGLSPSASWGFFSSAPGKGTFLLCIWPGFIFGFGRVCWAGCLYRSAGSFGIVAPEDLVASGLRVILAGFPGTMSVENNRVVNKLTNIDSLARSVRAFPGHPNEILK